MENSVVRFIEFVIFMILMKMLCKGDSTTLAIRIEVASECIIGLYIIGIWVLYRIALNFAFR